MFQIITSLFIAGAAHAGSVEPLQLRSVSAQECGVDYEPSRREDCGDEAFNSCFNKSCPGYIPEDIFELVDDSDMNCTDTRGCRAEAENKANSACTQGPGQPPTQLLSWRLNGTTTTATCKSLEVVKSCAIKACGTALYKSCKDPQKPFNKTCGLLLTRNELEDYIGAVQREASDRSLQFIVNKALFFSQLNQEKSSACLIKDHDATEQFFGILVALKKQFQDTYGIVYDGSNYSCGEDEKANEVLTFRDVQCSALSSSDIEAGLNLSTGDQEALRFYSNCGLQRTYKIPEQWITFNFSEISRLLDDLVAKQDPSIYDSLSVLKAKLENARVSSQEGI